MKKLTTMILAVSIAIGASTLLLAQAEKGKDAPKEAPKDGKEGKGKGKGKGKGGEAPADEKGKAPAPTK